VIHGNPSGLDNTTSCYGGAVKFSKRDGMAFERITMMPNIDILLTNTCVSRSTKLLVAKVKVLHDLIPSVVRPILDSIESISTAFVDLCSSK
jgi:mevalonate kinase